MTVWLLLFQICTPAECQWVQDDVLKLPYTKLENCLDVGERRVKQSAIYFSFKCDPTPLTNKAAPSN